LREMMWAAICGRATSGDMTGGGVASGGMTGGGTASGGATGGGAASGDVTGGRPDLERADLGQLHFVVRPLHAGSTRIGDV
jgi:hypothetical protein